MTEDQLDELEQIRQNRM